MNNKLHKVQPSPGHEHTLYREGRYGLDRLRILDIPSVTPGMVTVGRDGEDYQHRPELRWQVWPDLLEVMTESPAKP